MKPIKFYSTRGTYGCFSNFSKHKVIIDEKEWQTSEHYYQAMKFESAALQEKVRLTDHPGAAAKMGRDPANPLRADWDDVKDKIMYEVVYAKFTQNPACKMTLLETDPAYLIEDSPVDYYWGCGSDNSGLNKLGKVLMQVRDDLKKLKNKVVHCKMNPFDVYIGRPSKWGNPFSIGKDGDREAVIEKYTNWLLNNDELLFDIMELDGKTLGCWCAPQACHGDVIVEIIEEIKKNGGS